MEPALFDYLCGFLTPERLAGFERVLSQRTRYLTVVLEDLHHQHNASACLRSCDCFGVQDLHIIEQANEFLPNTEIALGATNWTTAKRYRSRDSIDPAGECVQELKANGYRLVGTCPRAEKTISELPLDSKTAIIFGNEKSGMTESMLELVDQTVRIPMVGFTESFNLSVAVAVALYDLAGRLRRLPVDWSLSDEEKHTLRIDWVKKTIGWKLHSYTKRYHEDQANAEQEAR